MIIDIFLPLSLVFIMFTLGLGLTIQDFKNIIEPNISSNFLVLRINIDETELLKLSKPIHSRSVWKKDHNWECLELNP